MATSSASSASSSSSSSLPPAAEPAEVPLQDALSTHGPFELTKCTRLFDACAAAAHDVPVLPFLTACEEIKKVVASLGTILGFASTEITEKVAGMLQRLKELRRRAAAEAGVRETLQWLIADEVARKGAAERNDRGHVSASRSLYRLMWVLDFISALLSELVDLPAESLREAATHAYEATLAPHHSWVMKKTVSAALLLLPSRAAFLKGLAGPEGGEDRPDFPDRVRAFVASFKPVRDELWRMYRELGLVDGRLE